MGTGTGTEGTPKNLSELAVRILTWANDVDGYDPVIAAERKIKDFLAQHFGAVLLKVRTPEQQAVVDELWESITNEKIGGRK